MVYKQGFVDMNWSWEGKVLNYIVRYQFGIYLDPVWQAIVRKSEWDVCQLESSYVVDKALIVGKVTNA